MNTVLSFITENIKMFRLLDVVDILIVAYGIYKGAKLIKETRAVQLIKGIVILLVAMQLSSMLQLNSINFILVNALQVGFIALLILFQPELRRALEKVGRSTFGKMFTPIDMDVEDIVGEITTAASYLSSQKFGALIVLERDTKLGEIIKSGITLNSEISSQLLVNIFIPNTPLHDGAVIIGDNRLKAAACFLPLTQNDDLSNEFGTRHRAAIGISENSDCVVVVVSEETGIISTAIDGVLKRHYTVEMLEKILIRLLKTDTNEKQISARDKIKQWAVKKK